MRTEISKQKHLPANIGQFNKIKSEVPHGGLIIRAPMLGCGNWEEELCSGRIRARMWQIKPRKRRVNQYFEWNYQ